MTESSKSTCTWDARIFPLEFRNGLASTRIDNWTLIVFKLHDGYEVAAFMEGACCKHTIELKGSDSTPQEAINRLHAITGSEPFLTALEAPLV